MLLPKAPEKYDQHDQDNLRGTLTTDAKTNLKVGHVFEKILMKDTATGQVRTIKMTSGALVIS
jgi:hypothetical protein